MKLITRFELAAKSETELYALLREVFNENLSEVKLIAMNAEMHWHPLRIFKEKLVRELCAID